MKEERLQEIKDSVEFQYTLAKAKGYDNALLFTNEEEELIEEVERLNNIIEELEKYIIDFKEDYEKNRFQPNAKVYIYWKDLIDKLQELKGSDKE